MTQPSIGTSARTPTTSSSSSSTMTPVSAPLPSFSRRMVGVAGGGISSGLNILGSLRAGMTTKTKTTRVATTTSTATTTTTTTTTGTNLQPAVSKTEIIDFTCSDYVNVCETDAAEVDIRLDGVIGFASCGRRTREDETNGVPSSSPLQPPPRGDILSLLLSGTILNAADDDNNDDAHWSGIGIPKTNAIALEVSYTHTHDESKRENINERLVVSCVVLVDNGKCSMVFVQ